MSHQPTLDLRLTPQLQWQDWPRNKKKMITFWIVIITLMLPGVIAGWVAMFGLAFLAWMWTKYEPEITVRK